MSHFSRLPSDVRTNAPLRVPTSTRTLLISRSPFSFVPSIWSRRSLRSLLLRQFFSQFARAIDGLAGSEILHFEDLADLNLALGIFAVWRRSALCPFDRLCLRLDLDDPEAADELLCF